MNNCTECNCTISNQVATFSIGKYNIPLCIEHQKWLAKMEYISTEQALTLYFELKQRGVPAQLEKFDGFKHIDIAIPTIKLNIEVDGQHHNYDSKQALADLKRTYHSLMKGYYTIRIPNSLTYNDYILTETADYLADLILTAIKNKNKGRY